MADRFAGRGPVVVIAPHPDDESLACAGLLADVWLGGGTAHVVCFTDGAASHPNSRTHPPAALAALRQAELLDAIRILGGRTGDVTFLGFPDAATHRMHGPGQDPVRALGAIVDALQPACIFAPSPLDPHCDHQTAAAAAKEVVRLRRGPKLFFYPVWSAWSAPGRKAVRPAGTRRFERDHRHRDRKRAAIDAHRSQRGLVVRDDRDGFAMPPGFAAHFTATPETFFEALR